MRKTCEAVRGLLPYLSDGGLGQAEGRLVGDHLATCPACRAEAARWSALNRLLAAALTQDEGAPADEVEAAVRRVREARPAWRVAPAPVRFWRSWAPAGALAVAAATVALLAVWYPVPDLHAVETVVRQQAAAVTPTAGDLRAALPDRLPDLRETVQTWPQEALEGAAAPWRAGARVAQGAAQRLGMVALVVCIVLLLAANVAFARHARSPRGRAREV